jgi:tRNA threonylcarbamoyladenosine biosynthesis protein TsaE
MTHATLTHKVSDEAGTEQLGRALAQVLPPGAVVALGGPLGAGKTRLVQAAAAAWGVDRRDVVSPTFVLVHEYHGRRSVIHVDAYRIADRDEFVQLGVEEYFAPPHVTFVEWAERVADSLPSERLEITIRVLAGDSRQFDVVGTGSMYVEVVDALRRQIATG